MKYVTITDPNEMQAAHGLTVAELESVHREQQIGKVRMVAANKDKKHKIPHYETEIFHVKMEAELFDQGSGKKLSHPRFAKFHPKAFLQMEKDGRFKGFKLEILHDPRVEEKPPKDNGETKKEGAKA